MDIAFVVIWAIVGIGNLTFNGTISKLTYACAWGCLMLELISNVIK